MEYKHTLQHPDLGINAISRLLILLDSILKKYSISIDLLDFFSKKYIHNMMEKILALILKMNLEILL